MTIHATVHLGWPVAVMILSWVWLLLCAPIGNLLQREWWMNVFVASAIFAAFATIFALIVYPVATRLV